MPLNSPFQGYQISERILNIVAYFVSYALIYDGQLWNSNDILSNIRMSFVFHNYHVSYGKLVDLLKYLLFKRQILCKTYQKPD